MDFLDFIEGVQLDKALANINYQADHLKNVVTTQTT